MLVFVAGVRAVEFGPYGVYSGVRTINPGNAADFTECYDHEVESARIPVKQCHYVHSGLRKHDIQIIAQLDSRRSKVLLIKTRACIPAGGSSKRV